MLRTNALSHAEKHTLCCYATLPILESRLPGYRLTKFSNVLLFFLRSFYLTLNKKSPGTLNTTAPPPHHCQLPVSATNHGGF